VNNAKEVEKSDETETKSKQILIPTKETLFK
jgi:hypothetical protein